METSNIFNFIEELDNLCEKHGVTIHTEGNNITIVDGKTHVTYKTTVHDLFNEL